MFKEFGKNGGAKQKMITKKLLLNSVGLVFVASCSNSSTNSAGQKGDSQGRAYDTRTGRVIHVEVVKDNGQNATDATQKANSEFLEIFKKKKQWSKMPDSAKLIRGFREMSLPQLRSELAVANEEKTVMIIEALKQRGETGIELIASLLNDTRRAAFADRLPIFWYEKKNQPPELVEIRVFAASYLAEMLKVKPQGVLFDYYDLQTSDLGSVKVLYALQGEYALSKDDLSEIWSQWWSKFKSDFTAN